MEGNSEFTQPGGPLYELWEEYLQNGGEPTLEYSDILNQPNPLSEQPGYNQLGGRVYDEDIYTPPMPTISDLDNLSNIEELNKDGYMVYDLNTGTIQPLFFDIQLKQAYDQGLDYQSWFKWQQDTKIQNMKKIDMMQ